MNIKIKALELAVNIQSAYKKADNRSDVLYSVKEDYQYFFNILSYMEREDSERLKKIVKEEFSGEFSDD